MFLQIFGSWFVVRKTSSLPQVIAPVANVEVLLCSYSDSKQVNITQITVLTTILLFGMGSEMRSCDLTGSPCRSRIGKKQAAVPGDKAELRTTVIRTMYKPNSSRRLLSLHAH